MDDPSAPVSYTHLDVYKRQIISLSSGILGEPFIKFELDLGLKRLNEYGINVNFMPHALSGVNYVKAHPEKRAEDLIAAFRDDDIDMILLSLIHI